MCWWSVYLVLFLQSVQGQNLELSGSGNFSSKGGEYTFTCTLQVPGNSVSFKRGTDNICTVNTESCSSNQSPGYRCRCYTNSQTIQLTITSVRLEDEANWLCQAFDASDVSNSVALPVYYPPKITPSKEIQHSNTSERFDVVLRCDVDSKPVSSVKWSNDTNNDLHSGTIYTLNDVPCDSEYNYTCTASNSIGNPVTEEFNIFQECSSTSAPPSQSASTPSLTTTEQSSDGVPSTIVTTSITTNTQSSTDSTSTSTTIPPLNITNETSPSVQSTSTQPNIDTTTNSFHFTTDSIKSTTGLSSKTTENARTELKSTLDLGLIVGVGISVGVLVVLGIVILAVYCWRRNDNQPDPNRSLYLTAMPESNDSPATEDNQPDTGRSNRESNDSPTESEALYETPVSPPLQDSAAPENSTINPHPSTNYINCSVNYKDNISTQINPIGDQWAPQDGNKRSLPPVPNEMKSTDSSTTDRSDGEYSILGEIDNHNYETMRKDQTES